MRFPLPLTAALLPLLTPALAQAAPATGEATPLDLPTTDAGHKAASVGGGSGSLVRTFVGLIIVIAVIYGLAWILRQVKASKEERSSGAGLSTAAVVPLGPGRSLHLVRAGREFVLVGVAEQGVTPIRTYSEEEALRLGLQEPDSPEDDDDGRVRTIAGPPKSGALWSLVEVVRERTVRH